MTEDWSINDVVSMQGREVYDPAFSRSGVVSGFAIRGDMLLLRIQWGDCPHARVIVDRELFEDWFIGNG
jgi:hypothetical protein